MKMKKTVCLLCAAVMSLGLFAGCQSGGDSSASDSSSGSTNTSATDFDANQSINVITRESGSGTRGAFIELFGVEEKDADGNKVDKTTEEASVQSSTNAVLTTVAGDETAIGYISLGSLNDDVKALKIDGAEASVANVKDGTYKVSRPFNIAYKGTLSEQAQDFVNFILSTEGQEVVEAAGFIPLDDTKAFESNNASGKVVISGSSSVTPVMEKLQEAYQKINANVTIEIQQTDSTNGMKDAMAGTCDIGMASRELKDSELESLTSTTIATDGIAVIVNKANSFDDLTSDAIKAIFTGEAVNWSDVK
ncbi:MAG: substrate-binding domain-containing protein [Oscillospiraceae bacterium]|jgi:phosphate transport system substrate-binding protein